jgi:hypothetical protein
MHPESPVKPSLIVEALKGYVSLGMLSIAAFASFTCFEEYLASMVSEYPVEPKLCRGQSPLVSAALATCAALDPKALPQSAMFLKFKKIE